MITNLFSTFDPATNLKLSINWLRTFIIIIIIPSIYWIIPGRQHLFYQKIIIHLYNEFKTLLGKPNQKFNLILVRLFTFILMNNIIGLLPYIFTRRRHLSYTLSLALPIWMRIILFGWTNKSKIIFAHIIPRGTPRILIPFIVIVETIRNLIRPISLAVRLTANIIAGHLLIRLIGNNILEINKLIIPLIIIIQAILILFEAAVSIIQAYVFSVLTTLYSREVRYV